MYMQNECGMEHCYIDTENMVLRVDNPKLVMAYFNAANNLVSVKSITLFRTM